MIERTILLDRLDAVEAGGLVLVTAGPGYGKSTLLAQWVARCPERRVMVSARDVDDDVSRLGVLVAESVARFGPSGRGLGPKARCPHPDRGAELLPRWHDVLAASGCGLVLDDVHEFTSPLCHEFLKVLALRWTAPGVLVLSGRQRPLDLVGRPGWNQLITLDGADLCLTDGELAGLAERSGTDGLAPEVRHTTGRWPAAIRVHTASEWRPSREADDRLRVVDYLRSEVLADFDENELDFLAQVSLVAPVTIDLLDRILNRDDSGDVLRRLIARGLPMLDVPDDDSGFVVVPSLLAEILDQRFADQPETSTSLIDRAVAVCERHRLLSEAFALRERFGRREELASMCYRFMGVLSLSGRLAELEAWLSRFSESEIRSSPLLALPYAVTLQPWCDSVIRPLVEPFSRDDTTTLPDGTTPARAVRLIFMAMGLSPADPDEVVAGWERVVTARYAWQLYAEDRLDEARRLLELLAGDLGSLPMAKSMCLAGLAIIATEEGRLDDAQELVAASRLLADGTDSVAAGHVVDDAQLRLARASGRLDDAAPLASTMRSKLELLGDGSKLERASCLIENGELVLDLGFSVATARQFHDEASTVDVDWAALPRLSRALRHLHHRINLAPVELSSPNGVAAPMLTAAELRVLQYLPSHFRLADIADQLFLSHNTVKSHCTSIYRRLSVTNRADAVSTAAALGLLPASWTAQLAPGDE